MGASGKDSPAPARSSPRLPADERVAFGRSKACAQNMTGPCEARQARARVVAVVQIALRALDVRPSRFQVHGDRGRCEPAPRFDSTRDTVQRRRQQRMR